MSAPLKLRAPDDPSYDVDLGGGWILFAGVLLIIAGLINMIYGIGAITDAGFYVSGTRFVAGNLHLWGWLLTIVGLGQVAVAWGVWNATEWGRWAGIGFAALNMLLQFLSLPSHPAQSVMVFFLDVLVIWGLLNYGGADRDSLAG